MIVAGRGNLGRSLTRALRETGHQVRLVSARMQLPKTLQNLGPRARRTVVFLTVPDSAVAEVASGLAGRAGIPAGIGFVHTSGALELGALAPLQAHHAVGSFHPLRSFPTPGPPEAFHGIVIAVDASTPGLLRTLNRLARELGARPRRVDDSQRALYHAGAVFASNYVVALMRVAVRLLEETGWSETEAVQGLATLAEGAVANVRKQGPTAALTGPIRRGDAQTVARHLAALAAIEGPSGGRPGGRKSALYRMLGEVALEIAEQAGLEPAAAERTRRALTRKVAATRRRSRR